MGTHNCNMNATCSNTIGSFSCSCNSGYSGNGFACSGMIFLLFIYLFIYLFIFDSFSKFIEFWIIDINECLSNNGGCDINALCTNTIGNFNCSCNPGYSGNGFSCSGMNFWSLDFFFFFWIQNKVIIQTI